MGGGSEFIPIPGGKNIGMGMVGDDAPPIPLIPAVISWLMPMVPGTGKSILPRRGCPAPGGGRSRWWGDIDPSSFSPPRPPTVGTPVSESFPGSMSVCQGAALLLIPLYALDLGGSPAVAAIIFACRGLGNMLADVPAGLAAEKFGDARVMQAGVALMILAATGCAFASDLLQLGLFSL